MNTVVQKGLRVSVSNTTITVNGVEYQIPSAVKSKVSNSLSMLNGRIKVNGFLFNPETGKFSRSFLFGLIKQEV